MSFAPHYGALLPEQALKCLTPRDSGNWGHSVLHRIDAASVAGAVSAGPTKGRFCHKLAVICGEDGKMSRASSINIDPNSRIKTAQ